MPEVIIKYKSAKVLQVLKDIAKYFDFVVEKPATKKELNNREHDASLPITFSENPDITALAGIWKGRDISLTDLRKKAWGDRL